MVMNPRTHPRGAPPDFTLPKPNPNPSRMTDALWWLVCMREALEPQLSENGGTVAAKPGYHSWGSRLPDYGLGDPRTDHSIRRAPDRSGPWWKNYTSAHDWTFLDAQRGNYATIDKYTSRLVNAMRDPNDLRPDDVYAYTLGQMDNDRVIEGYNEYRDEAETSDDETHTWHRHDSFRRNIIGLFAAMWKALTIDMGWTYEEWQQSVAPPVVKEWDEMATKEEIKTAVREVLTEPHRFPGQVGARVHDRDGWAEMGDRTTLAYLFEGVMAVGNALQAFVEYEKAEDVKENATDQARAEALARLEQATARIESLVTPE